MAGPGRRAGARGARRRPVRAKPDAAIVTRLPGGPALAEPTRQLSGPESRRDPADLCCGCARRGIAHGALGAETILLSADGVCIRDFRCASSSAPAAGSTVTSRRSWQRWPCGSASSAPPRPSRGCSTPTRPAGPWSTCSARRSTPPRSATLRQHKDLLPELRTAVAGATGIEVPKLAEAKRISWVNLVFGIGTLIGIWAIIGVLADVAGSLDVIKGARWGWVALAFVLAQLPVAASAWSTIGAVTGQLPFGRCLALETSNTFTSLVGGDVAVFAVRVRFFQRQGYDAGGRAQLGGHRVDGQLDREGRALPGRHWLRGRATSTRRSSSGGHQTTIWIVVGVVLAAGIAAALITDPAGAAAGQRAGPAAPGADLGRHQGDRHRATQDRLRARRLGAEPDPRRPRPRGLAARGRGEGEPRHAPGRHDARLDDRWRRPRPRRRRRRRGRPDRRAHQRRACPRSRPSRPSSSSGCSPPTCRRSGAG